MKKEIYKEKLELKEVSLEDDVPFSKIICPSCNEQVTSDNLDLAKAVAKCGSCHVVFPIKETLSLISNSPVKTEKPKIKPPGIEVFTHKDQLEISLSNKNSNTWVDGVMLLLTITIPCLIFLYWLIATGEGLFSMAWFIGSFFLLLIPFNWFYSARKKNKILFNIYKNKLSIEHRPSYLKKAVSFDLDTIEQFYVKSYGLYIVTNDLGEQKHTRIHVSSDLSLLRLIEETIESHLDIKDMEY